MFLGIEGSERWRSVEPLEKGWSSDRKFVVTTGAGEKQLLRLSDAAKYESKAKEYAVIGKYAALGFPMSEPVGFGLCEGGTYMLLTWVEGRDLEEVLPTLSEEAQYRLGREAGEILRRIHGLPLALEDVPTGTKKAKKLAQLRRYEASDVRLPGDEPAVQFVKDNLESIWQAAPVYQHGDFHPGNLIYRPDGTLGVIDFNRWEVGDPWEEFYKLESFARELSVPYCAGQIDAYFADSVPAAFWPVLAVYVAHASLFSIEWARPFGQADVDAMTRRCRVALEDYEGFKRTVPRWYEGWKERQRT